MDVSLWQQRLEHHFTEFGVVGGHLLEIIEMENAYGQYYEKTFHGQSVLMDSFQSFYIETIRSVQSWVMQNGWPKAEYYAVIFLHYVTLFKSFRACENLLIRGYPLDGYALLRDIKDRAIQMCGIAHNLSTFYMIQGYDRRKSIVAADWHKKIKERRKKEERRISDLIIRKQSNLPSHILEELARWERLFHDEVHGSQFTFFSEGGDWMLGKAPLPIGPVPNESSLMMYMNRAAEIAWLLVRLLPYLQPVEKAFGPAWKEKYQVLDDSFRFIEEGLRDLGKKIGSAFIFFVDQKFSFPDEFHYFEADGSGS